MSKKENINNLKPHYAPNVKPYKRGIEIYPHTEFHRQEPFWTYRELGLLKQWLMSLTKLCNKLALQETEDVSELTEEIKNLINKLQNLFNEIEEKLLELYDADAKYKYNNYTMLAKINTLTEEINNLIVSLNPLFENIFDCIENRLIRDDTNINNIYENIENIYNILEAQYTSKTKTLIEGVDYDIVFFNGFRYYNDEMHTNVTIETTNFLDNILYSIFMSNGAVSNGTAITNDYVYTADSASDDNAPIFHHNISWENCPQSWVYGIKFKNDYDFINDCNTVSTSSASQSCVWNMLPLYARPSWQVNLDSRLVEMKDNLGVYNAGRGILLNLVNIADGLNNQYYSYVTNGISDYISFADNLNCNMTCNVR